MSANPMPDPSQQPITAADPRVQQILDLIRAKNGPQAPLATTDAAPPSVIPQQPMPQVPTQLGGPSLSQQLQQANQPPGPPPAIGNLPPMTPPQNPQLPQPPAPNVTHPGPIKAFLQHLVSGLGTDIYAGSQAAKQRLGIPTDYEMQQNAAHLGIAQQAANDNSEYRKAITALTLGKGAQLDQITAPYAIDKDDQSVLPQFRGKSTTFGGYQALQKLSGTVQGKADVAEINLGAPVTLSPALAQRAGMPQLAGQQVNGKTLSNIQKLISATGSNIIQGDIGNGHTGLIDKDTQQVLQDFGPSQRIIGANIGAQNRTVQVVNPNDPNSTIQMTPAQANAMGAQGTQSAGFQASRATLKDFTSGADARTLNAINTARGHTTQGIAAVDALNNGDVPALNRIAQFYHVQTGNSAPLVFNSIKNALEGEISKSLTGAGATVSEIAKVGQDFSNAGSPQQLKDVFSAYGHLLDTKKGNLADQFAQGMRGTPNFSPNTSAPPQGTSGLGVKLSDAMALPQNKGKTAQQVTADIQAHGHAVIQ